MARRSEAEILQIVYRRSQQIRARRRLMRTGATLAVVAALGVEVMPTVLRDADGQKVQTVDEPDRVETPPTTSPAPSPQDPDVRPSQPRVGSAPGVGGSPTSPSSSAPGTGRGDASQATTRDRVAYLADIGRLHVAHLDGTDAHEIAAGVEGRISWSPDGTRITYFECRANAPFVNAPTCSAESGVMVMNSDGSAKRMLAQGGNHPAWSPDGRSIAFRRDDGIYVINPDGTGQRQVLAPPGTISSLDWSPDGKQLAFTMDPANPATSCVSGCDAHIHVVDADGSDLRQLTFESGRQLAPAWSPDGTRIAFAAILPAADNPDHVIYTVRSDGTGLTKLTDNPTGPSGRRQGRDSSPDWTTDGRIIWVQEPDDGYGPGGIGDLHMMNADGSMPIRLFRGASPAVAPRSS